MNMTMLGHALIGLEIIIGLWLSNRLLTKRVRKIIVEFNGKNEQSEEKSDG